MSLSDKRFEVFAGRMAIKIEDVREAVKELRILIEHNSSKEGELNYFIVYKAIDEIFGDELTKEDSA